MLRPFFPELFMSTDLLSFEHPSVLLFCFLKRVHKHNVFLYTCCMCFVYVMLYFGTSYIILKFLFLFFAILVCIHYITMNRSLHSSLSYLHWITFKLFNDYYSTNKVLGLFRNNLIWYVSLFLIGWKVASISVWMKKKQASHAHFWNFFSLSRHRGNRS